MRSCPTLAGALVALAMRAPSLALADLHLRWNDCFGETGATSNQTFACNTDAGFESLVASFTTPDTIRGVVGFEVSIDLLGENNTVPDWWNLTPGAAGCRSSAVVLDLLPHPGWTSCQRVLPGSAAFGWTFGPRYIGSPGTMRLRLVMAVPAPDSFSVRPDQGEMFLATITLAHSRTAGADSCAGCGQPLCMAFTQLGVVTHGAAPYDHVYQGCLYPSPDCYVTWQNMVIGPWPACPSLVPVRNRTWGEIKARFR